MLKRLILILTTTLLLLSGCSSAQPLTADAPAASQDSYFVVAEEWWDPDYQYHYSIVYAADTKVMYLMIERGYKLGITVLYNGDGSIRLYE